LRQLANNNDTGVATPITITAKQKMNKMNKMNKLKFAPFFVHKCVAQIRRFVRQQIQTSLSYVVVSRLEKHGFKKYYRRCVGGARRQCT
jgi:hypothetical protein